VWYSLAAFQVAGVLAIYLFDYPTFHLLFVRGLGLGDGAESASNDRHLGNALLLSTGLVILALVPLARKVAWRPLLLGEWSVTRSVLTGVGVAIGIRVLAAAWQSATHAALGTDTTRGMQGIHASYGLAVLLLYAALIVPIVEEFVFRGVLLRTISRYFAVWVAVLVQAVAFAVSHDDLSAYPVIFLIALMAAWLARRSGGLLAAITLHCVNNVFATLSIVVASKMLENLK
jgi:membrane protease YdiL (CAAX protease family)